MDQHEKTAFEHACKYMAQSAREICQKNGIEVPVVKGNNILFNNKIIGTIINKSRLFPNKNKLTLP